MGIRLHARAINQRIFAVAETAKADGPMGSVRIVDLTSVIMGPFATHILADMRAERSATRPTSGFVAGPLTSIESKNLFLRRKENSTWYRFRTMN
jgi:hypothetical protein